MGKKSNAGDLIWAGGQGWVKVSHTHSHNSWAPTSRGVTPGLGVRRKALKQYQDFRWLIKKGQLCELFTAENITQTKGVVKSPESYIPRDSDVADLFDVGRFLTETAAPGLFGLVQGLRKDQIQQVSLERQVAVAWLRTLSEAAGMDGNTWSTLLAAADALSEHRNRVRR